jgi:hypothetical protein
MRRVSTLILAGTLFWLAQALPAASLFTLTLPYNDSSDNGLSYAGLNDHVAGSLGHVTAMPDGHLYVGGQRIRFWGANVVAGGAYPANDADSDAMAGRLAKFGVNIVRFHHMDNAWGGATIWQDINLDRTLNPVSQDRMDYLFNALKQHGIYANINLVVSRPFQPGSELDPSTSLISDWKVRAVLGFFDPAALQLEKDYAHDLLTHVNAYTGLPYTQDPAVAFVEVNNENGLVQAWMSGQLDTLPGYYVDELRAQWNNWLTIKYGTEPVLESAWGISNQPLGPEKALNGHFATNLASWNWELNGSPPATGSASVQPDGAGGTNVARLIVSSVGQQGWHAQFQQSNLSVTAGAPYTLEFWAKASSNRTLALDLMQGHSPWGNIGFSGTLNLTTSWQKFSFVIAPNTTDANGRINFGGLGLQTGTVWIGDVSFKSGGILGLYPGEALGSGQGIQDFLHSGETTARTTEARRDWLRFLLQTEEAYWQGMRDYLKSTLGLRSLVMGTIQGCSTPNVQALFDAIDSHYYWHHPAFPSVPWDPIDWYVDNGAMVDDPTDSAPASIGVQAVYGKPHSVTELNTPYPGTFEGDIQMITAAYGGLNDLDAIYPFAYWGDDSNFSSTNMKDNFTLSNNPVKMAGSPAAAAAFRRGDFSPSAGMVAVPQSRAQEVEELLTAGAWSLVSSATAGEDRRAPLIRRVRQIIEGQTAPGGALAPGTSGPYGSDLASETGELDWQTGGVGGLVTGNSARTQFAAGFLNGRTLSFGSVTLSAVNALTTNDYAVISLSSHDGLPLTATASALLTVLGCQRNIGSTLYNYPNTPISFPPAKGALITLRDQWGTGPVQVEGVSATVALGYNPADVQVFALNPDGSRGVSLPVSNVGGLAQVVVGPAYQCLEYEVAVARTAYSPTPTRTPTQVLTPTPSRTLTPTPSITPVPANVVWEDGETGAVPASWQAYVDTSSGSITGVNRVTGTAGGVVANGLYSQEVAFNSGTPGNWGGGFLINSSYGTKPSLGWRDLTGMQVLRIKIWTNTPGLQVRATLSEAGTTTTAVNGADGEVWEANNGAMSSLLANTWNELILPLSSFRDKPGYPYNPTSLGDNTLDLGAIAWVSLEWAGNQGSNVVLRVDDVIFDRDIGTATVTPSITPTRTPSPTLTPTPTLSPTASASPVATATVTPSATPLVPTATRTPVVDPNGELKVQEQRSMPQPLRGGRGSLFVKLAGGAEALDWKLYSPANVVLAQARLPGPFGAGWSQISVALPELPAGICYSVLRALRGDERSSAHKARFYVLR